MVEAYTIDGKITLNTEPFDKAISDITSKMETLMQLGGGNWNFNGALTGLHSVHTQIDTLKKDIESMSSSFSNVKGINALKSEIESLRTEMDSLKAKINEIGTTATEQATKIGNVAKANIQSVKTEISAITSSAEPLTQIWSAMNGQIAEHYDILSYQESEVGQINAKWRETQLEISEINNLMKLVNAEINGYSTQLSRVELANKQIELYLRREQDIMKSSLMYLEEQTAILEQERALEEAKLIAEENLNKAIAERMAFYNESMAQQEREMEMAYRVMTVQEEMNGLIGVEAEEIIKIADSEKLVLDTIQQQVATERERLGLIADINAMNSASITKMPTGTTGSTKGSSVNQLDKMGNMTRRIASMTVAMWGFNEAMDVYNKTMANINAKGSMREYTNLLKTDNRYLKQTKQSTADVTNGLKKLNTQLYDNYKNGQSLQEMYRKVDMTMVGANALDTAFKYGVEAKNLGELTEAMAIYSSEFVRQGRSQEDAILAVNDALDGEFRRLKEVNIGKEELEAHGYKEGNTLSLIRAMNEIAEERGYDITAKKIMTLSDAINVAELELSFLLSDLFEIAEPSLIYALERLIDLFHWLGEGVKQLKNYLKGLPQPTKDFLKAFGGNVMLGFLGLFIGKKIWNFLSGFKLLGSAWTKLMEKLGKTKGIEKATESFGKFEKTTTGGTVGNDKNVGFKEGFKEGVQGLGKNLGTMAKVFVELAVAIGMAFALLEEAMLLIGGIGATYDAIKPQFDSGIEFIQEFGIWIWGASAVLIAFMGYIGKFEGLDTTMLNGAKTMAKGLALAMGLIAEAIGSLILPLGAIALLGALQGWQEDNINKGIGVIRMFGNALNELANNDALVIFLGAFVVISAILGVSGGTVALPLATGIALSLGLIAEAILLLALPLGSIALLGVTYGALGEENVSKGAEVITLVGNCLKALEPAIRNLLLVDVEMFGVALVDFATKLATGGKDGITALSEDIIPKFVTFAKKLNEMDMPTEIDSGKITALTTIANQIPPLYTALQKVNTALATSDAVGNVSGKIGSSVSNAVGMGLSGKLDQIYNDSKDIMDWATKMSTLKGSNGTGGASAVTQVAQVIVDLKAKLTQMSTTISESANSIQSSATQLGKAIITGWKSGSASFGATVVQTVANGVRAVQNRYNTMANGGRTLGNKLSSGFNSHSPKLQKIVSDEIQYALWECDNNEQNFYSRGAKLGRALSDGFESEKGMNVGSPARIARAIAQEMIYSKNAIDMGAIMMYRGGQALGSALADGYADSQLKTNIGMLTQTGVSNEEITNAQTRNAPVQNQQGQGNPMIININMNGANIFGVEDLENTMRNIADRVFIEYNDVNPNIGG